MLKEAFLLWCLVWIFWAHIEQCMEPQHGPVKSAYPRWKGITIWNMARCKKLFLHRTHESVGIRYWSIPREYWRFRTSQFLNTASVDRTRRILLSWAETKLHCDNVTDKKQILACPIISHRYTGIGRCKRYLLGSDFESSFWSLHLPCPPSIPIRNLAT